MGAQNDRMRFGRIMWVLCLAMAVFCLGVGPVLGAGTEYYVDIKNGDDANDGSFDFPWRTLHFAFGAVPPGVAGNPTVLHVMSGQYDAYSEGDFGTPIATVLEITKAYIHVKGECRPEIAYIDIGTSNWTNGIEVRADGVIIEGLKITGFGNNGIISENYSPVIQRNIISSVSNYGIWISALSTEPVNPGIYNNLIYGCQMGGIFISGNDNGGVPEIYHNTIDSGYWTSAIGIWITEPSTPSNRIAPLIHYNIVSNFSSSGTGLLNTGGSPQVNYNCFYNNDIDCQGWDCTGVNNIFPTFPTTMYIDSTVGNYELSFGYEEIGRTLSPSPCIDAIPGGIGNPLDHDLFENVRPESIVGIDNGGVYDMGAFEKRDDADADGLTYQQESTYVPNPPDPTIVPLDPGNPDTDYDEYHDGEEILKVTDPLSDDSSPVYAPGIYYVDAGRSWLGLGTYDDPWQTLHMAVHHVNGGEDSGTESNPYELHVVSGVYSADCCKGREPETPLEITQNYVVIIGEGKDVTILDGTPCDSYGYGGWGSGVKIRDAQYVTIRDLTIRNFGQTSGGNGVSMEGAKYCAVASCRIHGNGFSGVNIGSDFYTFPPVLSEFNAVKDNCEIFHNGEAGIYISNANGNQIRENGASIYDNGKPGYSGVGVWITGYDDGYGNNGSGNNLIVNNTISYSGDPDHFQGAGVKVFGLGTGNEISENFIYGHVDAEVSTGVGIEAVSPDTLISRNILKDNYAGVYVDDEAGGALPEITNNLMFCTNPEDPSPKMAYGIWLQTGYGNAVSPLVYHNTIDGGGQSGIYIYNASGSAAPAIQYNIISNFHAYGIENINGEPINDYNCVWSDLIQYPDYQGYPGLDPGAGDIPPQDPLYVDPANGDYHLQSGSPCIDTIPTSDVLEDLNGVPRPQDMPVNRDAPWDGPWDMGAYETTYANGTGTEIDPFQINTAAELDAVRYYPDSHFVLNADIDLNQSPWNEGEGWNPIGTSGQPFAGRFDGGCRLIDGLHINRPTEDFVGFFGFVESGAEISSVLLLNADVIGHDAVGALAGKNNGGTISACAATGAVYGNGSGTGGVGGLVGYNPGLIENCYAAVHVTGTGDYIGGLVGKNFYGVITTSYATGQVIGNATAGGLSGLYDTNEGTVNNSYWNTETSGLSISEGGTGLTSDQMRQQGNFTGWGFGDPWFILDGRSFPYLCSGEGIDFGDAPDSPYPTILAMPNDGARHNIVPGYYLGNSVDNEPDGQPDPDALGDDNDGNDDEDGVVFNGFLSPCLQVPITIMASAPGDIDAWIDFNADGDWMDAGEEIFSGQAVIAGATNLNFTVPCDAVIGTTFARFRFSSTGGLAWRSLADDGEVEDYAVEILESMPAPLGAVPSIPDTGQSEWYDDGAIGIIDEPEPGQPFYGQDPQYQPQHPRSYTKLGVGGVELPDGADHIDNGGPWLMTRDNVTGLIWEIKQDKDDLPDYENPSDADNAYAWTDASDGFIAGLNDANFGGSGDWRLPTVKELTTLVNSGLSPAIDASWFPNIMDFYWTRTEYHSNPAGAWGVGIYVAYALKDVELYAMAVRGGAPGAPINGIFADGMDVGRLVDNGDGTVTDTATGLMWQQETDPNGPDNWETALSSAEGLVLAGHSDWRLPNRNELQTLVDYTRFDSAIDPVLFPDTDSTLYWSSTTDFENPGRSWRINFLDGGIDRVSKTDTCNFRAVRGGRFGTAGGQAISSPNQGGRYAIDETLSITWDPAGFSDNVNIWLSRDGGGSWQFVESAPNSGSFEWPIIGSPTANAVLRIEDAADPYPGTYQDVGFFSFGNVYNLFVTTTGTGSGTVTSTPEGVDCPATTCVGVFAEDTSIQLDAAVVPGSTFTGWTGGPCGGTGACSFTITGPTSVTANFELSSVIGPDEYYVDSAGGNDANDGLSMETAWQTLHHAIQEINNGTSGAVDTPYTLYLKQGGMVDGDIFALSPIGVELPDPLYITQHYLSIVGLGAGAVIDGTGASGWIDGLDIQSAEHVEIRNLIIRNFPANGIHMGGAKNCVVDACRIHGNGASGIAIEEGGQPFGPSAGNIIQGCTIFENAANGVYIYSGSGNMIQNGCAIYNNGANGIYIFDSADNQIINNTGSVYDNGNPSEPGVGIRVYGIDAVGNLIESNAVYVMETTDYLQEIGIQISGAGEGNRIIGNTIYGHQAVAGYNGFGIEVVNSSPDIMKNVLYDNSEGVVALAENGGNASPNIWNNLIYDDPSTPAATMLAGIMLEIEYSDYIGPLCKLSPVIYHNTIDGATGVGMVIDVDESGGEGQPRIEYNIISNYGLYGILNSPGFPDPWVLRNNIYSGAAGSDQYLNFTSNPTGDIHLDPLYVDATAGNYQLQNVPDASPCIDYSAEATVPSVTDDIAGVARPQPQVSGGKYDIGCYETALGVTHTVIFIATAGGNISGETTQTVVHGGSTTAVTASPFSGYEFAGWTGDAEGTDAMLTVSNVTADMTIYASFRQTAAVARTVQFIAGAGGGVSGNTLQIVTYGSSTSEVTAVPNADYEFIGWTGGYNGTANPLSITNVTSDMTIYANFREKGVVTHTVAFAAGVGGSLSGNLFQTIPDGGNCTEVAAAPDEGYEFDGWSGSYTGLANPLTITGVTSDMTITANFRKKTYDIDTSADAGGGISGIPADPVPHGETVTLTATPEEGYEFVGWSGDYTGTQNPLTLTHVTSNINIVAHFKLKTYTVVFIAGAGGGITGELSQTVDHGQSAGPVTAVPEPGYHFAGWSGDAGGTNATLTVTHVISDMAITALFEENPEENQPPARPALLSPANNAVMPPGPVTLMTGPFSDPEDDAHVSTWWQVGVYGSAEVVYEIQSGSDLTSHAVPGLASGVKYQWRAAYQDAGSGEYVWSDTATFLVGAPSVDENIPPVDPGTDIGDYRMVSFVSWPLDASAASVFGPLLPEGYDPALLRIGTYDPVAGEYLEYPDFSVEPGRSYWFLAREGMDLSVEGIPVGTGVDFCMPLGFNPVSANGWNMIAPPNDRNYFWGDLTVTATDSAGSVVFGPMPVALLTPDNPYLDVRIWAWAAGDYAATDDPGFALEAYNGYWVRAKQAGVSLCFPADAPVAMRSSEGRNVNTSLWDRMTTWLAGLLPETDTAHADAGYDKPPMPMAALEVSGDSKGCFIETMKSEGWPIKHRGQ